MSVYVLLVLDSGCSPRIKVFKTFKDAEYEKEKILADYESHGDAHKLEHISVEIKNLIGG